MADTSRPGTARMLAVHAMLAARLAAVLDSMPALPAIQEKHCTLTVLVVCVKSPLAESTPIPAAEY